jgi:hypothetical protein
VMNMARVVAFPASAPRTSRRDKSVCRVDGDGVFGKVIVFTGVWHERVDTGEARKKPKKARKTKA